MKNSNIELSVILPVYNYEKFIKQNIIKLSKKIASFTDNFEIIFYSINYNLKFISINYTLKFHKILSIIYQYKKNIIKRKNLKALVTAGPTREYLDPVRYISNESSGKQGFEIAEALSKLGIKTTLITGPSHLYSRKDIKTKKIITANEMFDAVKKCLPVDIAICAAAVADFKPIKRSKTKIKKDTIKLKSIELERNRDIVEFLGKNNKHRPGLVIGFAAETENLNRNAFSKLRQKNCDLIVVNDVSKKDSGLNSDYNRVSIIDNSGKIKVIKKNKKSFIANVIAEIVLDKLLIDDRSFN